MVIRETISSMGHWQDNTASWYEQQMTYCTLCGRLVPKHLWIARIHEEPKTFCSPECEDLYRDYWLPSQASQPAGTGC